MRNTLEKPKVVVIGASGHAKVIIDIIERQNLYTIVGLLDSYKPKGFKVFDYEVIGSETMIPELLDKKQIEGGIIAIGDNGIRISMANKIATLSPDFIYISAIHPLAAIGKNVVIGEGTVVVAGAIINTSTIIKKHVIINTKASIGHDCTLDDFVSIAPGATIGGNVIIQYGAIIALGSNVLGNCTIGKHALIGSGAVVTKNVPDNTVVYGIPANKVKMRKEGDPYL
ncbi:acetyltransferase [Mariniflexile sp.]|uniref:acetyltransferase n=1 Tax=Mariniflexile sp. TaxID=1979402 RepID=UPI00356A6C2F